jgi:hypothetical protein
VRLWHDDVRPAPPGWTWARTNDEAKRLLATGEVTEASLDHDLGYEGPPPGEPCPECDGIGTSELGDGDVWECPACEGGGKVGDGIMYLAGQAEDNGLRLVEWMCETGNIPPRVTVHSWNPDGARQMAERLRERGCPVEVSPFDPAREIV